MLHDGILTYALKRIHYKVRQMIGKHGFTEPDFDDLRQELILDVLKRLPKFKGERAGIKTFICRVIDNRIASFIKHQEAGCRDYRRVQCSIDDWVRGESGRWTSFGTTITEEEVSARRSGAGRSRQEEIELTTDVQTMLGQLSEGDRDLCIQLETKTILEVSRRTGIPRGRIYARIRAMSPMFCRAEMHCYL